VDAASGGIEVHARGGEVALLFAAATAATLVAFGRLRDLAADESQTSPVTPALPSGTGLADAHRLSRRQP